MISMKCSVPKANCIGEFSRQEEVYLDSEQLGHRADDLVSQYSNSEERKPMDTPLWWELVGELCEVFSWFAGGDLKPEDFAQCVVAFESEKVERFGFAIAAEVLRSDDVLFTLRHTRSGQIWSTVHVDPHSGEFRIKQD